MSEGGRPRIEFDLQELERLCGLQCTQADLAGWFNVTQRTIEFRIAEETVYDHDGAQLTFKQIMERGYSKGRVSLRRRQMAAADAGNATMLVWLGKNVLGQRDNIEVTGDNRGPIETIDAPARELVAARIARLRERDPAPEDPGRPE